MLNEVFMCLLTDLAISRHICNFFLQFLHEIWNKESLRGRVAWCNVTISACRSEGTQFQSWPDFEFFCFFFLYHSFNLRRSDQCLMNKKMLKQHPTLLKNRAWTYKEGDLVNSINVKSKNVYLEGYNVFQNLSINPSIV